MSKIVDKGSGLNVGEDNSVTKMMDEKKLLMSEIDQKNQLIQNYEQQMNNLQQKINRLDADLLKEKEEVDRIKNDYEKLKDDNQREVRKIKITEEEKKNLQGSL